MNDSPSRLAAIMFTDLVGSRVPCSESCPELAEGSKFQVSPKGSLRDEFQVLRQSFGSAQDMAQDKPPASNTY